MEQMDDGRQRRVIEIRMDQIPSIQDIKNINNKEDFVAWAEKFIQEVAEETECFPHANLEVTMFLGTLKNWVERYAEVICSNTGIMDAAEIDWRSVAFVIRGVLQSHSDV